MNNKREDLYLRTRQGKKVILKAYVKKKEFEQRKKVKVNFWQKMLSRLKFVS